MKASFIQRQEVQFDLHSSLISPPAQPNGICQIRLGLPAAKALMYALRDAIRDAGEEV